LSLHKPTTKPNEINGFKWVNILLYAVLTFAEDCIKSTTKKRVKALLKTLISKDGKKGRK
jgi:hypothetical protein